VPEGESKEKDNSQFINQIGFCENHTTGSASGYPALIYLQADPLFENRRADPRFRALVQKIGIDPRL